MDSSMGAQKSVLKTSLLALAAIALALALTAGSVLIQSVGPELSVSGNLCGPTGDQFCYEPTLKGGFPFAYLYDKPGISVGRQLGPEDELKGVWFIADWLAYWALVVFAYRTAILLKKKH